MKPFHYPLRVLQNRLGAVPRPSYCTYLVTHRCNALCGMCDSWKMPRGRELTADEVARVFADVGSLDIVRLTGGEPFLRDDLLAIAEAILAQSAPLVVHVTTNGSFPERVEAFARAFSAPKRLALLVSLDGLPEEHDKNRGRSATFAKATDTVERVAALGIRVAVNHTIISRRSLADHRALKARFRARGVEVQWVIAYEDSAMYGLSRIGKRAEDLIVPRGYPLHPSLDREESAAFVEEELARGDGPRDRLVGVAKRYYWRGLLERLRGSDDPRPHPKCVALRSHLRLLPDGSVPVCQFNTEVVGNLLDRRFEDVWSDVAAQEARAWVDGCPGCWAECEVVPSAIYSGDLWSDLLRRRRKTAGKNPGSGGG